MKRGGVLTGVKITPGETEWRPSGKPGRGRALLLPHVVEGEKKEVEVLSGSVAMRETRTRTWT